MKKIISLFFLLCCIGLSAQEHILLQKEAEKLYNENNFSEALKSCEKALLSAEKNVGKNHAEYIQILHELGNYKILNSNLVGGITDLLTAEAILKNQSPDKLNTNIQLINDIGIAYHIAGMGEDAERYIEAAVLYKEKSKSIDNQEYANLLGTLAEVQRSLAKYKECELNLLRSKKILDDNNLNNTSDYGSLLNNMASFYHDMANFLIAEKYYKQGGKIFLKTDGEYSENYATSMQNTGDFYSEMNAYDEAEKYLLKAQKIKAKIFGEESFSYATVLNDLAYLYHHIGLYAKSEDLYLRTLKLKEKLIGTKHDSYLRTKQNLAMLYNYLGRIKPAEKILEEVVAQISKTKKEDPVMYTDYIENLGCVYIGSKKYNQAEKLLKEALESYKNIFGENHPEYVRALNNLAYLYDERGDIKNASEMYELAINICNVPNTCPPAQQVISYSNMAAVYKKQKKTTEALKYIDKSLEYCKASFHPNNDLYLHILFEKANMYADLNKIKEADALYSNVLDKYFQRLDADFAYMNEAEKGDFLVALNIKLNNYYAFLIDAAELLPDAAGKMFDYRLTSKAALLNTQSKIRNNVLQSSDTTLLNAYAELKKINNYLSKLYSLSNEDIIASKVNIDSLQSKSLALEKKVSLLANHSPAKRTTWKDIQQVLADDEVAIEIIRTDSMHISGVNYGVLLLTKVDPKPFYFVMDYSSEIDNFGITNYLNGIKTGKPDTGSFKILFEEIYRKAGLVKKIYFSGDGVYNQINIATLYNPIEKMYLDDEYEFSMLTNLADVITLKKKKNVIPPDAYAALFGYPDYGMALNVSANDYGSENLLALNRAGARGKWNLPPLPGTKIEVEEIDKLLSGSNIKSDVFLGDKSDEAAVKKIKNPFILHIATHGFFEANVPKISDSRSVPEALQRAAANPLMRSGVMMAGASNAYSVSYNDIATWENYEDGVLTAYEVMNLDLDETEVVVLSACQTGLGEIKNGEGVYGLQRAFFMAGANSVIMSLWSVSDEATRDLMIAFYKYWLETGDKHWAFNEAQKEIKFKYKHSFYWGAFVLMER